jgi:predicted transcriptional regulator
MSQDQSKRDQAFVSLPRKIKTLVDRLAEAEDRTLSATVVRAVVQYAEKQAKANPDLRAHLPKK